MTCCVKACACRGPMSSWKEATTSYDRPLFAVIRVRYHTSAFEDISRNAGMRNSLKSVLSTESSSVNPLIIAKSIVGTAVPCKEATIQGKVPVRLPCPTCCYKKPVGSSSYVVVTQARGDSCSCLDPTQLGRNCRASGKSTDATTA